MTEPARRLEVETRRRPRGWAPDAEASRVYRLPNVTPFGVGVTAANHCNWLQNPTLDEAVGPAGGYA